MKHLMKTLCVALLAAGLLLPACEKPADKAAEKTEEAVQELEKAEEKAEEAEEKVEEKEEEAAEVEAAEINEDNYIKAAFEVTCVSAHIDDPARARELKDEIYPRYGFDEASFKAAQEALASNDMVKAAVAARMERCNKEFAEKLGEAQVEGEEVVVEEVVEEPVKAEEGAKAEAAKKPAKPVPAKLGAMNDTGISGGGFTESSVRINVRNDFGVSGEFRGKREGAAFMVPFKGTVSEKGDISATGERGGNTVTLKGKLSKTGATGSLSGSVHKNNFNTTFNAK